MTEFRQYLRYFLLGFALWPIALAFLFGYGVLVAAFG